jgi:hypothetical protein
MPEAVDLVQPDFTKVAEIAAHRPLAIKYKLRKIEAGPAENYNDIFGINRPM